MIPRVAKLGTGFVGAGMYYMHDKRDEGLSAAEARRPSAAEYFLTDKGPAQTAERVGFTATRNLATDDPMKALRQMAFTAAHAQDIRMAAVAAAAKAAGMSYDAYVKAANPFRGRKGTKPVYSLSLSWKPGDETATKETMLRAADEVRGVLGLKDHQCVIIEHTDTKHPHVHMIINRVHPTTGKYASVANDRLKLSNWALDWEKRHGKIVCPERPENWKKREANTDRKRAERASGNADAKAGYVKNTVTVRGNERPKGHMPQSEIDFWNEHGSANLSVVRAARAKRQQAQYESYHRETAYKLRGVDAYHERANGKTIARIERTLRVLKGGARPTKTDRPASIGAWMFGAVRGAAHAIVARIHNRTDIAKLEKIKAQLIRERDIRRAETLKERRQAYQKMQRIHAWQNWLDEQRCRTYQDSDVRAWRDARDRWDMGRLKPPLFGTVIQSRYDVAENPDPRQAIDDRRRMNEPLEMKPIPRNAPERVTNPHLPTEPSRSDTPYVKRDPNRHAEEVAERAKARMAERGSRERTRTTGRKRRPRPR